MNRSARNLLFLLLFLIPVFASADEQQKAHKALNKLTAMAIDPAGKRAVSMAMAQRFSIPRGEMVQFRHAVNLNYGDLFVAYKLVNGGAKMEDIASQLKAGNTVWRVADEQHADWKRVARDAKKLSGKVDHHLLGHFAGKKSETERDRSDGYDPVLDNVKADGNVSQQEIEEAQQRYIFLREHAGTVSDSTLDTSTEKSARMVRTDPIRTGGPTGTATSSAPKK